MAITLNKTPENRFNPITIPTEFSVSSTNVNQPNFKYVCDLYIDGESGYYRMKQSPHPVNGYTVFDVSGIMKSFITSDAPKTATSVEFQHASNSYRQFTCKFGEEYGQSSAIIVYPNLQNLTTNYYGVVNASLDFDEWANGYLDFDGSYTVLNSSKKFLTNSPTTQNVYSSTRSYLYFLNNTAAVNAASYVEYKGYDTGNNLTAQMQFDTSFDENKRIQYVGAGYKNIELVDGTELNFSQGAGALPFFTAQIVVKYTVQLFDSLGQPVSELRTFNVAEDCNIGDTYQLIFQNKLGGYDTFTFRSFADKSYSVTTKDNFKKRLGAWNGTDYEYESYQRGTTQYNTIYKDKVLIKSDWISEEESEWLHELITSPDVYMVFGSREQLMPINIIDSEYQVKKYNKDQLFNLQLTIEKSFNRYRQQF